MRTIEPRALEFREILDIICNHNVNHVIHIPIYGKANTEKIFGAFDGETIFLPDQRFSGIVDKKRLFVLLHEIAHAFSDYYQIYWDEKQVDKSAALTLKKYCSD